MSTRFAWVLALWVLPLWACRPGPGGRTETHSDDGGVGGGSSGGGGAAGSSEEEVDGGMQRPPIIGRVLPGRAPTSGGLTVLITGSGLSAPRSSDVSVTFGTRPSPWLQLVDDTQIYVEVPAGLPGAVDVRLTTPTGAAVCRGCLTYYEGLQLRAVAPNAGSQRGGSKVVLKGGGFNVDTRVLFGSASSPAVRMLASDTLEAVVPPSLSPGAVPVAVLGKNGFAELPFGFRYRERLELTDVAPLTGPVAGGIDVILEGTAVDQATEVWFGAQQATALAPLEPGRLRVAVPAASGPGSVDVKVVTALESRSARGAFTYVAGGGFAAYAVFPHLGPRAGGNEVTVTGEGLDAPGLTVRIGGLPAAVVVSHPHQARVRVPAGTGAWRVDVDVSNGTSDASLPGGYTHRLELERLSPSTGPAAGGTAAHVEGRGLPPRVEVSLGALNAVPSGSTDTAVDFLTPQGSGQVALSVRAADDAENEATLPAAYTYVGALYLGAVTPPRGAIAGGTLLRVVGDGFGPGTTLSFGQAPAKDLVVVDSHTLRCRLPPGAVGPVKVTVTRSGETDTLPDGFAYFDPRVTLGGVSGELLRSTLNITVLDNSPERAGEPVADAWVMLGLEGSTGLQGQTDARGQLTFSSPLIVKAQQVTVWKDLYEPVIITDVSSENLTVLLRGVRPGGPKTPGEPEYTRGVGAVPPSLVIGRVTGLKPPSRALKPTEQVEARVFVSQPSVYVGPPFREGTASAPKWIITHDNEQFLLLARPGIHALAAVLGTFDSATRRFSPYLMGMRRRVAVQRDEAALDQDIVLDTHLDAATTVKVMPPLVLGGAPALNSLYGWLDLGFEGVLPLPSNWGAGAGGAPDVQSTQDSLVLGGLPQLDADNFLFLGVSTGSTPQMSFNFHHQQGPLSQGISLREPLMPPTLVEPAPGGSLARGLKWTTSVTAPPDLMIVEVGLIGADGAFVRYFTAIVPGTSDRLLLPQPIRDRLSAEGRADMVAMLTAVRVPRFSYNSWSFQALTLPRWSKYAVSASHVFGP